MTQRRYTQDELLREAWDLGFDEATPKLISRWETKGLLDEAERGGRGVGGGKGGYWTRSEQQRRLWLTLLQHRRRDDRVRHLVNIPVWVWLHWGDAYVPLRQLKRGLETWTGLGRKPAPREDHPKQAARLVRELARPSADPRAKAALRDALIHSWRDQVFDADAIRPLLDEVVGPPDRIAQLDGQRAFLLLQAHWAAIGSFFGLSDGHYRWARAFYLMSEAGYQADHEALAADADPRVGALHQGSDVGAPVLTACSTLLRILGMGRIVPPGADLPEPMRLEPWLDDRASLTSEATVVHPSLLVPAGAATSEVRVKVSINVRPPEEDLPT